MNAPGRAADDAPWPAIDRMELRRVLGSFVTGVTVITTLDRHGRRWGLTANSFSSVSLDPPLVLWSQALAAPSHAAFRDTTHFAVHILARHQEAISRRFATAAEDKFAGLAVAEGIAGVPLLEGCLARLECRREAIVPGGDHAVFLGRVLRMRRDAGEPLVFAQGRYLATRALDPVDA